MKRTLLATTLGLALFSPVLHAAQFTVSVQNLTQGLYFTPLLVAAHNSSTTLFTPGAQASVALQSMAEGGDISSLSNAVHNASGQSVDNPAGGLLPPGDSITTTVIDTDNTDNTHLSVVAMILPSNDGFIGLNSYPIPTEPGTYTIDVNAYDAGTEANDELINSNNGGVPGNAGIPAAPGGQAGTGGSGVTDTETNTHIHIHRGTLGDTDANGGASDLNSQVHRWLNPVARVTITVQ